MQLAYVLAFQNVSVINLSGRLNSDPSNARMNLMVHPMSSYEIFCSDNTKWHNFSGYFLNLFDLLSLDSCVFESLSCQKSRFEFDVGGTGRSSKYSCTTWSARSLHIFYWTVPEYVVRISCRKDGGTKVGNRQFKISISIADCQDAIAKRIRLTTLGSLSRRRSEWSQVWVWAGKQINCLLYNLHEFTYWIYDDSVQQRLTISIWWSWNETQIRRGLAPIWRPSK